MLQREPGHPHQLGQVHRPVGCAPVGRQVGGVADRPAGQPPSGVRPGVHPGRSTPSRTSGGPWLRPRTRPAATLSGPGRRTQCRPGCGRRRVRVGGRGRPRTAVHAAAGTAAAQRGVVAVGLVVGHPPEHQQRVIAGAFDHPPSLLRLGREQCTLGDARVGEPVGIGEPGFGQMQLPVDENPLLVGVHIRAEHPDLALGDLAFGAGVLTLHPGRAAALLLEPRCRRPPAPRSASPSRSATCARSASRTWSASQRAWLSSRCIPSGRVYPANSADQPFLRSSPLSKPSRNHRARTRGSRRPGTGATTCAKSSSNPSAHPAGSTSSTVRGTATADRLVHTHPDDHSGGRLTSRPRPDRDLQGGITPGVETFCSRGWRGWMTCSLGWRAGSSGWSRGGRRGRM
ncbi:hypothetical protein SAMN06265355_104324 [Actinomadura mexicana]|uniref:Uncharacterized protein n=1 Tax=Actinomadura mexicana TaxID=134959 RepID=A0A238XGV3_9ACTN|nr:hypothetical protein SAMN06265355_104324 [Actinomadura mexicana]